jgi:hypothetical protein
MLVKIPLLGNGLENILAETKLRNNRRAVFSVVSAELVATRLCGRHISAAMN